MFAYLQLNINQINSKHQTLYEINKGKIFDERTFVVNWFNLERIAPVECFWTVHAFVYVDTWIRQYYLNKVSVLG